MAVDYKLTQPVEYYRKFLKEDVRPDGRTLQEVRSTVINIGSIGTAEGSALVKLGKTTVVCGIKAELTTPKAEEPDKGFIVPNVDLPPLCGPQFRPGPPSDQAQVATQFVSDFLSNSGCIKSEDLCIAQGKLCWVLYCDMLCLDYDGSILDACAISLIAALKNASLPTVTQDEESGAIQTDMDKRNPLQIHTHPTALTFTIFDDNIMFVDPSCEEENLASGVVTIVINSEEKLFMVHKPGGSSLTKQQMENCMKHAQGRAAQVEVLINDALSTIDR